MNGHVKIAQPRGLNNSLYHLLKRASQKAADILSEKAGKSGLTQRQYAVLSCLADNPGASQTFLVKETGIDRSTLADLAARLEERQYIRRESSPADRRAKQLFLEPAGRAALADMAPVMADVEMALLAKLTPAQQGAIFGILKQLAGDGEATQEPQDTENAARRGRALRGDGMQVVEFPLRLTSGR